MARELNRRAREVVDIWIDVFNRHDLLTYASAIAFQVLKSLIPLSLLAIAVLGEVGRQDVWTSNVAPALKKHLDPTAYRAVAAGVQKIFAHNSSGLTVFAALLAIWYVSGGVRGIMGAMNRIYEVDENRPFWTRWPISFGLAVCVAGSLIGAILLVEVVPTPRDAWEVPVMIARWVGAVLLLALAAGLLVRLGPVERRPKKWASAGGILVVVTWVVLTIVFRAYIGAFANFKTAVGQLTVFIVLMAYVYASSIVFLVGVELDELLRADASADERGILDVVLGR